MRGPMFIFRLALANGSSQYSCCCSRRFRNGLVYGLAMREQKTTAFTIVEAVPFATVPRPGQLRVWHHFRSSKLRATIG
jgi:hypothetical protein